MSNRDESLLTALGEVVRILTTISKSYATVHHLCEKCGQEMTVTAVMLDGMLTSVWLCEGCEETRPYVNRRAP